jgi:hypothetical protein
MPVGGGGTLKWTSVPSGTGLLKKSLTVAAMTVVSVLSLLLID